MFDRDPNSTLCWDVYRGSGLAMDDQAEQDFETLAASLEATGVRIEYIVHQGDFGADDATTTFDLNGCTSYVRAGRAVVQEDGALETIVPLRGGWHLVSSC